MTRASGAADLHANLSNRLRSLLVYRRAQFSTRDWSLWPEPARSAMERATPDARAQILDAGMVVPQLVAALLSCDGHAEDQELETHLRGVITPLAGLSPEQTADLVEAHAEELVAASVTEAHTTVSLLVEPRLRAAVLSRRQLAERWPWSSARHASGLALQVLASLPPPPAGGLLTNQWPGEAAPVEVMAWACERLRVPRAKAAELVERARRVELSPGAWRSSAATEAVSIPPPAGGLPAVPRANGEELDLGRAAVLYLVEQEVKRDRRRLSIAVDAGQPHHALLGGIIGDVSKDTRRAVEFAVTGARRIELLLPGRAVQLELVLPGDQSLHGAVVHMLRKWRGWMTLRHWAALLRLLSVEGSREGWVRWTLDQHLEALGYAPKERTRQENRQRVAREVALFTEMELAAYDKDGKRRDCRPLLHVGSKFQQLKGSEWALDGMELRINPLLYRGVRADDGQLGANWHPAPVQLAQVDHHRHPYTLALGLMLPIRWRLALNEDRQHIDLTGENLLALAAVGYRPNAPGEAWRSIERDLDELRRIGGLGSWEWVRGPKTLAGVVRLRPADWMLDRTSRDIAPEELPPGPSVMTGEELRGWRKARGWSQAHAARALEVSQATVSRFESQPDSPVPNDVVQRLRHLGSTPAARGGG